MRYTKSMITFVKDDSRWSFNCSEYLAIRRVSIIVCLDIDYAHIKTVPVRLKSEKVLGLRQDD